MTLLDVPTLSNAFRSLLLFRRVGNTPAFGLLSEAEQDGVCASHLPAGPSGTAWRPCPPAVAAAQSAFPTVHPSSVFQHAYSILAPWREKGGGGGPKCTHAVLVRLSKREQLDQ